MQKKGVSTEARGSRGKGSVSRGGNKGEDFVKKSEQRGLMSFEREGRKTPEGGRVYRENGNLLIGQVSGKGGKPYIKN